MTPDRSESLPRDRAAVFLRKAEDFAATMRAAQTGGSWNGAALAAVHCVISACDAVTTRHLGERSRGQAHGDLARLLQRVAVEGAQEQLRQVGAVLQEKNRVEYEAREVARAEAEALVKRADRILEWARRAARG